LADERRPRLHAARRWPAARAVPARRDLEGAAPPPITRADGRSRPGRRRETFRLLLRAAAAARAAGAHRSAPDAVRDRTQHETEGPAPERELPGDVEPGEEGVAAGVGASGPRRGRRGALRPQAEGSTEA